MTHPADGRSMPDTPFPERQGRVSEGDEDGDLYQHHHTV
jgi:hypothetical protein